MNSAPESVHREPRERPDTTHIPGRERRKNAGQGVSRRKVQEAAKSKRGERRVPYAFANRDDGLKSSQTLLSVTCVIPTGLLVFAFQHQRAIVETPRMAQADTSREQVQGC
jgi:hypothetical protein